MAVNERFPFKAHVFGRLVLTWCNQAGNAPLVDRCWTRDREGRRYRGFAIRLCPWRREFGHSAPQPALVVGWRSA